MIHDKLPHRLENEMRFTTPQPEDTLFVFSEPTAQVPQRRLLCRRAEDGALGFPTYGEFDPAPRAVYLFAMGDVRYFMAIPGEDVSGLPEPYAFENASALTRSLPREHAMAAATGLHLYLWYRSNKFCGHCGRRLAFSHKERALECRSCGNMVYPKIAPAVIVAVTNGDKLLLTRYAHRTHKNRALVAGFVEIGETAEEAVQREVMEECGIRVKNIRYYKSQPWGIAENLLFGYFCELDGPPDIKLDENELGYAEWVPREDIFEEPDNVSLTNEMIQVFKAGER